MQSVPCTKKARSGAVREKVQMPKSGPTVRGSGWQEIITGFMLSQDCGELSCVSILLLDRRTQSGNLPWLYFF